MKFWKGLGFLKDKIDAALFNPNEPSQKEVTDADRLRLRTRVTLACDPIAYYWPIRTFIYRNPLHGFEHLPFDEAVRVAGTLFGGRGYLSNATFRAFYQNGRINARDLSAPLARIVQNVLGERGITLGNRALDPAEILRLQMIYDLDEGEPPGRLDLFREDLPAEIRACLRSRGLADLARDLNRVGGEWTLSDWLQRLTGRNLPAEIRTRIERAVEIVSSEKSEPAPSPAEIDALLGSLGIAAERKKSYLRSLERESLRFIVEREGTAVSLERFAMQWLSHERALLSQIANEDFQTKGRLDSLRNRFEQSPEWYYNASLLSAIFEKIGPVASPSPNGEKAPADQMRASSEGALSQIGLRATMAEWCSREFGVDLIAQINDQMIKWCAPFLDEGLASWTMPDRDQGFYNAWRTLARYDRSGFFLGLKDLDKRIGQLPSRPEDALLFSLRKLGIPMEIRTDYLTRHLAQLPGWAGYIKWRSDHPDVSYNQESPINPLSYLAVRLFYESEVVDALCRKRWGIPGSLTQIQAYLDQSRLNGDKKRERSKSALNGGDALSLDTPPAQTDPLSARVGPMGWRLYQLAQLLALAPDDIRASTPEQIGRLLDLLDALPPDRQGPIWLEAYERHYRDELLRRIAQEENRSRPPSPSSRPAVQAVFCIDVREEGFRRHLEAVGDYETFSQAGFFGVPLCFRPFGSEEEIALAPVLVKPKHLVFETHRPMHQLLARQTQHRMQWSHLLHNLYHQLKYNLVTPFVLVEAIGGLFGIPLIGKTLFPRVYHTVKKKIGSWIIPPVDTAPTIEKISKKEAEALLEAKERGVIWNVLVEQFGWRPAQNPTTVLEELRLAALSDSLQRPDRWVSEKTAAALGLSPEEQEGLIHELRAVHGLNLRQHEERLFQIGTLGFTQMEKVYFVETSLRLIGLTENFARLVLLCGHGSESENNPYAAALDCGACGGNHGGPNARVLSAMANKPAVRALLRERGIDIPDDTYFIAGEYNTTSDQVTLFDTEIVPGSHRPDLDKLIRDLRDAGARLAQERSGRLPGAPKGATPRQAVQHVAGRSRSWSEIRPEWGLSGNAAFIIGRRSWTKGIDLNGRVFLHSYDPDQDPRGKVLETIMTAPLIVGEWINMEYYFSSVDNGIYGSGTKVIHNVVGGIGVMAGNRSDLRVGLPWQTVMDGDRHYHEPMRLLVLIEAPLSRVEEIIRTHQILQHLFNHRWMNLVVLDPEEERFYSYEVDGRWERLSPQEKGVMAGSGSTIVSRQKGQIA